MKNNWLYWLYFSIFALILTGCANQYPFFAPISVTPEGLSSPQAAQTNIAPESNTLKLCMGAEPTDLFIYGVPSYEKSAILDAIYDGPIDRVNFAFQPVILERLPSLVDNDVIIETVQVQEGQNVVDDKGLMTTLLPGVIIRPKGCRLSNCAVPYQGGIAEMEHMIVTFHLKTGLTWSDGSPLTASDSVFSYRVSITPEVNYATGGLVSASPQSTSYTQEYIALDDTTTRWTGLPGFLDPNYQANFYIPLPQNQLMGYSIDQLLLIDESQRFPMGWGSYRITNWDPGNQITMERNPYYFRSVEGLPNFEKLIFRFVGQNVIANLNLLQEKQCDILLMDTFPSGATQDLAELAEADDLNIYLLAGPAGLQWEQLTFDIIPVDNYTSPAILDNQRVRAAVAQCLDRQAFSDAFTFGFGSVPDAYLPPGQPLYAGAQVTTYPYDPIAGAEILEQVGWKDQDGNGFREAHNIYGIKGGTPLRFDLVTTDAPLQSELNSLIVEDLKTCGIDVTITQLPSRELFMKDSGAVITSHMFDLAQYSWFPGWIPPCDYFMTDFIPSSKNGWGGNNVSGYSNPPFDEACRAAMEALPGTPEYVIYHQEAMRIYSEDIPALPLFLQVNVSAARPDLIGILTDFAAGTELRNIEAFQIP